MKHPEVDLSQCILCGVCVEVCPAVFSISDLGYVQITEMETYPTAEVDEAVKNCPVDCISWMDD